MNWISIKDKLPEINIPVLVYNSYVDEWVDPIPYEVAVLEDVHKNHGNCVAWCDCGYRFELKPDIQNNPIYKWNISNGDRITHWMPLPERP